MNHAYFVSAYVTSPSFYAWDPVLETQYFQALSEKSEIIGIEHPFMMGAEKYPLSWMLEHIPESWSIIVTTLPVLMQAAKKNPFLGLASVREKERSQAVNIMEKASQYVCELNHTFGRSIVKAVHFHSLPSSNENHLRGSKAALKQSLLEMKEMNWGGGALNLEHCDAYVPGQIADKGLLRLKDEIETLREVGGYGLVLNWARSAIEGRSAMTPLLHLKMAQNAGLLKGFFFSGCTDSVKSDYGCWKDTHMPPKDFIESSYLRKESLLGLEDILQILSLLYKDVYLGVKVLNSSKSKENIQKSIGMNIETILAIKHASKRLTFKK